MNFHHAPSLPLGPAFASLPPSFSLAHLRQRLRFRLSWLEVASLTLVAMGCLTGCEPTNEFPSVQTPACAFAVDEVRESSSDSLVRPDVEPLPAREDAPPLVSPTVASAPLPEGLPVYRCRRVEPIPDGTHPVNPEAAPWNEAAEIASFRLYHDRSDAKRQTRARLVYDADALHVLFHSDDPDIHSRYEEHQNPLWNDDVVEIFLDPDNDGSRYFEFQVSPRNKRFAAEIGNNQEMPPSFRILRRLDPERLESHVVVDGTLDRRDDTDRSWTAYMRIPFSLMGISTPRRGERWRGNLYRIDHAENDDEYSCWSAPGTDGTNFHIPAKFGVIEFH